MNSSKLAFPQTAPYRIEAGEETEFFPLAAVSDLIMALNHAQIRYCHWKSNSRLDWGLTGRTDLDLLIDLRQKDLFTGILTRLEIKRIVAQPNKQYPGLEHYLGFDPLTGNLFHLHVHYQLVLGEQHVKNYHFPIEDKILDLTREKYSVKIPVAEVEVILLSIRAVLKYRDRDGIKDIFSILSPGIPEHILKELLWLLQQSSIEQVKVTLANLSFLADNDLVLEFLNVIQQAPRSGWRLLKLRSRLRKVLRPYQRKNRLMGSYQYFQTLASKRRFLKSGSDQLLRFPEGGKRIAIVGIDGSGKSTHTEKMVKWLEWKVSAPLHYLGSKQPSRWSEWAYVGFRIFRRTDTILSNRFGKQHLFASLLERLRQFFLAAHYLFVGFDRHKRYKTSAQQAKQGSVVIFDRFPFFSPLDGPEIPLISEKPLYRMPKRFSEIEASLYRKFNQLDRLIILDVHPDVSVERKPDHSLETIQAKYAAIRRLKNDLSDGKIKFNWVQIEADQPLEQVFLDLKKAVWEIL